MYSPSVPGSSKSDAQASSSKSSSSFANRINAAASASAAGPSDPSGSGMDDYMGKGDRGKVPMGSGGMKSKWLKAFKSLKSTTEPEK